MIKICDVIKYEGDNSTFVWKHPAEDFNCLSQLIVHESQEAIFFLGGQALDVLGPGRHTLKSENIPLLSKLISKFTGDETPFHCEVYFINKTVQMSLFWGTDSRVRFIDPLTEVPLDIGASGTMNLQVCDSRKLVTKLVGTMKGIAWGESREGFTNSLNTSFRPLISTAVKTHLANTIENCKIDILQIDKHLEILSMQLRNRIAPGFEEYGLTIPQLYVTTVSLPENDPNFKKIRNLRSISLDKQVIEAEKEIRTTKIGAEAEVTAAQRQVELERQTTQTEIAKMQAERDLLEAQVKAQSAKMAGLAEADVMAAKGYSQKDVLDSEVQKAFAEGMGKMGSNGGSGGTGGGMMNDIVSLGVGLQAAEAMTGQLGGIFKTFKGSEQSTESAKTPETPAVQQSQVEIKCANCGKALPENAKFCLECGTPVVNLAENEMICPECGKKTLKGKFCMECGASLVLKCAKCGAEIPTGAKFCLECGERL